MIGLASYSWLFGPHFDLYQSLNLMPIWNSQNCSMFPLAFVAGSLQGHWWGFISRHYVIWPIFFLMNVFIALKGTNFLFLFTYYAIINLLDSSAALQFRSLLAFIRENTLYISLLHYTGIIATSRWIQFQLPISVVYWHASPISVWACEGAELHVPHTKRTWLARPVICLNRTLITFENAMFLSYLRMARWFSPKSSIFSTTYRMA